MTDPTDAQLDADWHAAVAAAPPPCRCGHPARSHGRSNHSTHATGCYSLACGCTQLRPVEEPPAVRCGTRAPNSDDGYCPCALEAGHDGNHQCSHGDGWGAAR